MHVLGPIQQAGKQRGSECMEKAWQRAITASLISDYLWHGPNPTISIAMTICLPTHFRKLRLFILGASIRAKPAAEEHIHIDENTHGEIMKERRVRAAERRDGATTKHRVSHD